MSCFPGPQAILGLEAAVQPQVKKGKALSAVMGLVTSACHSIKLGEEPVSICPCQYDPSMASVPAALRMPLQPLHWHPCPALSILSDWDHPFPTGSLASNPRVPLMTHCAELV